MRNIDRHNGSIKPKYLPDLECLHCEREMFNRTHDYFRRNIVHYNNIANLIMNQVISAIVGQNYDPLDVERLLAENIFLFPLYDADHRKSTFGFENRDQIFTRLTDRVRDEKNGRADRLQIITKSEKMINGIRLIPSINHL